MDEQFEKAEWYYEKEGIPVGPVTRGELKKIIFERGLTKENLVFKKGMVNWIPISKTKELIEEEFTPPPIPLESESYSENSEQLKIGINSDTKPSSKFRWGKIVIIVIILIIGYYWLFDQSSNEYENHVRYTASIGEAITTDFFKIQLNEVYTTRKIDTGNPFSDVRAQNGNKFLVLDITFKNISNESRIFTPGNLQLVYNGQELQYDHQETVMADGWMTLLDQINPYTVKHTRIVYQIPLDLLGDIYWIPGRNSNNNGFHMVLKEN
jgi:hypothetical protein